MNHVHRVQRAFAKNWLCPLKLAGLFFFVFSGIAFAQAEGQKGMFSLTEEDDSFANPFGPHQDRHYTQGLKISYMGGDESFTNLASWLDDRLPEFKMTPTAADFGWTVGQSIYTPEDILSHAPIKNDRPYAGWLYTGPIFQRRDEMAANFAQMENFEINFGIVGPASLAAEAQKTVHRWWFPDDVPKGWDNQLKNEPGILLKYGRAWRWSPTPETARFYDILPHVGGEAGNVATLATAGLSMRLGLNLPNNFGEQIIDSPISAASPFAKNSRLFSAYFFGGVDGRAVAHDITLDGNSFRSGPSLDKYPFVADLSWGFALQIGSHLEAAYVHIDRTKEFRGQQGNDIFGSFDLKLNFEF